VLVLVLALVSLLELVLVLKFVYKIRCFTNTKRFVFHQWWVLM
jgi:hypothetical protein